MNPALITYLADHPRVPKPHAREGIRTARQFNRTTEALVDMVLTAWLAEEMETEFRRTWPPKDMSREQVERIEGAW